MHNAVFQPILQYSARPVLKTVTVIISSLEEGELGKKIYIGVGEMSDFVRKKIP